jgi:hypothetical protein
MFARCDARQQRCCVCIALYVVVARLVGHSAGFLAEKRGRGGADHHLPGECTAFPPATARASLQGLVAAYVPEPFPGEGKGGGFAAFFFAKEVPKSPR